MLDATDALVGEVNRDAEAGFLDEETLHLIERPSVFRSGPEIFAAWEALLEIVESVQVLVDIGDTILPELIAPRGSREVFLQNAVVSVKRGELAGFLLKRHSGDEIIQSFFDRLLGVFINILPAVLIEVDPAIVVDAFSPYDRQALGQTLLVAWGIHVFLRSRGAGAAIVAAGVG